MVFLLFFLFIFFCFLLGFGCGFFFFGLDGVAFAGFDLAHGFVALEFFVVGEVPAVGYDESGGHDWVVVGILD